MRRIALVCDWYHPRRGGLEAHLHGLASRLTARGHSVCVITSTPGPVEVGGIRVHRLDVPRLPVAGVAVGPVTRSIEKLLASERIDVVHSHVSIVAPVALCGGLAAHRGTLPSVLTFHSFVPATPVLAAVAGRWLGAAGWRAVMTAVSRRVVSEVSAFAPDTPMIVLPNGVDLEFWSPDATRTSHHGVRLVFAGRLQAKKRPLLLLRVLRELLASAGDVPWSLTVVGEGPLEARLRAGIHRLGAGERVRFAGWTDRDRLRETLRASDVFLSTATRESFGLAALEARAVGLPVVAMRDSAVSDFITHDLNGLLPGDDEEFARGVARLVKDEALRNRLAAFDRRELLKYDWDEALAAHERMYDAATDRLR